MAKHLQAYVIVGILLLLHFPHSTYSFISIEKIKNRLKDVVIATGNTVEAVGHVGESTGDVFLNINEAQAKALTILGALFDAVRG